MSVYKLNYNDEHEAIDNHLTDRNVVARRNTNIRDNIFVSKAISINIRRKKLRITDIKIFG